jgi:hypothetical protein
MGASAADALNARLAMIALGYLSMVLSFGLLLLCAMCNRPTMMMMMMMMLMMTRMMTLMVTTERHKHRT